MLERNPKTDLVESEGRSGVALDEHVAAGGLLLHGRVLLLDLDDPGRAGLALGDERHVDLLHPFLVVGVLLGTAGAARSALENWSAVSFAVWRCDLIAREQLKRINIFTSKNLYILAKLS